MSVRTPRVCPHPEFRIEQLPVSHILCSAMPVQLGADQKVRREKLTASTLPIAANTCKQTFLPGLHERPHMCNLRAGWRRADGS